MPHCYHPRQHFENCERDLRLYDPIPILYFLLFIPICCNMCNTRANPFINCLDLPINLSVCRREGECRSLCRNGEMPHCHNLRRKVVTEMRVTRPDTSPMHGASSPLAWSLLPHKCTVLSGCPDPDALRLSALAAPRIRAHQYLQPGAGGETQAAHNPYCSVN